MKTTMTALAAAGLLALGADPASAAVIQQLEDSTALSFAGNFESVVATTYTRDYDGFTFGSVAPNGNVWTSAPQYSYGPNGTFKGPLMALNSFGRATFSFIFDNPVAAVLAEFNWNPCCQATSPLVISAYDSRNRLLETFSITGPGSTSQPGFFGFGEHATADIKRIDVAGSIFGVRNMSTSLETTGGVPEPATWALMLMGFFGLGGALRASRRTPAAARA